MAEVFAFAPSEFEIQPAKLYWEPPCQGLQFLI